MRTLVDMVVAAVVVFLIFFLATAGMMCGAKIIAWLFS